MLLKTNKSNLEKQKKSVHTEIQIQGDWIENEILWEARSGSNETFTQSFSVVEWNTQAQHWKPFYYLKKIVISNKGLRNVGWMWKKVCMTCQSSNSTLTVIWEREALGLSVIYKHTHSTTRIQMPRLS